jgi:hypothetical protein
MIIFALAHAVDSTNVLVPADRFNPWRLEFPSIAVEGRESTISKKLSQSSTGVSPGNPELQQRCPSFTSNVIQGLAGGEVILAK